MKKIVLAVLVVFSGAALAHGGHEHGAVSKDLPAGAAQAKPSEAIQVSSCWIRSLPQPAPSAGYFLVKNAHDKAVKLQAAVSPTYGMIMLHQTTQHNGMSKMSEAHDIVIPANGELEFKPGGYHAMLEKATTPPAVGSTVDMDFLFDNGEKATAQCEVKPANTQAH